MLALLTRYLHMTRSRHHILSVGPTATATASAANTSNSDSDSNSNTDGSNDGAGIAQAQAQAQVQWYQIPEQRLAFRAIFGADLAKYVDKVTS